MSLIPIKLLCNRRPKSSSGSGSGSSSGTTTNSAALPDWFYFNTEENSVHCKYPLVGDSEVSAFGYGSSSGSGGGGGGEIDPSVLENYVTKDYLSQQIGDAVTNSHTHGNKTTLDKINETSYSHWNTAFTRSHTHDNKTVLDGITATQVTNWDNAVAQLESSNFDGRITELQDNLAQFNDMYWEMNDVVTSHTQYLNSYNTRLNSIEAILAYMQLCEDSNGNAYIKFTCPIVSTGEIEAYK